MSNPLRLIRKYQKRMMVIFGVLLMLAFVVGGAITDFGTDSRDRRDEKAEVVKWQGGTLTRGEMDYLKMQHSFSQNFLVALAEAARAEGGISGVNVQLLQVRPAEDEGDRDMLQILMLAKKAEDLGMVVGEQTINDYLGLACDNELNDTDYRVILKELTNDATNIYQIKDHLKKELLAMNMFSLITTGFTAFNQPFVTPVQSLAYDARQFRTVKLELVKFPVADFLGDAAEPSDRELKKTFEEGKSRFPDPRGEIPGFRRPRKVHFDWVSPDLDAMRPSADQISEEAIQARYQEWVEDKTSQAWEVKSATADTDSTGTDATDGANSADGTDTTDATGDADTNNDAAGDAGTATDNNADGNDTSNADGQQTPPNNTDDQSRLQRQNGRIDSTQFVSLTSQDEPGTAPSGQDPPSADNRVTLPDTGVQPPRPAGTPTQPGTNVPSGTVQDPDTNDPSTQRPEPTLKPIEDVRDLIIADLQSEMADAKAKEVINEFREDLSEVFDDFIDWEYDRDEDEDAPRPEVPDFEAKYGPQGLKFGSTGGLVNLREFADTTLAQQQVLNIEYFQAFRQFPTIGMIVAASFENLSPFDAEQIPEENPQFGSLERAPDFVYWLVEKKDRYTPTFDEARDEVVEFMKMQSALEDAKDAAQALADDSNQTSSPLTQVAGDRFEVKYTESFPWMSVGAGNLAAGSGQLQISEVRINTAPGEIDENDLLAPTTYALEGVGDRFMSAVFDLQLNEAGIALSESQDTVFAVRVIDQGGMDRDDIKTQVIDRSNIDQFAFSIAQSESFRIVQDWMRELEDEMNVRWQD